MKISTSCFALRTTFKGKGQQGQTPSQSNVEFVQFTWPSFTCSWWRDFLLLTKAFVLCSIWTRWFSWKKELPWFHLSVVFLFFLETFLLSGNLFRTCLALSLCHPRILNLNFSQYFQHCRTSLRGLVLWPQIDGWLCFRAALWMISCFVAACVHLIRHNVVRNDPGFSAQLFQCVSQTMVSSLYLHTSCWVSELVREGDHKNKV